jgi:hypothetical protein
MKLLLRAAVTASALLIAISVSGPVSAQKRGGILKTYDPDSPGGLSIQEEATVFARGPMGGVFNNLIMYDQHVPQNSLASIVPESQSGDAGQETNDPGLCGLDDLRSPRSRRLSSGWLVVASSAASELACRPRNRQIVTALTLQLVQLLRAWGRASDLAAARFCAR